MIPVYLYGERGPQGLMFRDFQRCLTQICSEHQKAGRASAFALILFDFASPQLSEVLDDPKYWAALDSISGKALTVFAVHAGLLQGITDRPPLERMGFYRSVQRETRQGLAQYFELEAVAFPVLLFFQVANEQVVGTLFVGLQEQSKEAAFNEIKELLKIAAGAVVDSAGRSIREPEKAFASLQRALSDNRVKKVMKSAAGVIGSVTEFVGSFLSR